ncbi:MAG: hypothetical protein GX315_06190 [Spirochaetales bacterium]|jgi:antitoxin component YwqK of YwqJK toxin-antitoxin module|nr:hypothetical protein [Spirochaetales bacterium]
MRNKLLILFLFCSLSTLSANPVYRLSNSIGQDRGPYQGEGEYVLVLDDSQTQLYQGQTLLWTRKSFLHEGEESRVTRFAHLEDDQIQWFSHGNLVREQQGSHVWHYSYADDGKLKQSTHMRDNVLEGVTLYGYGGPNGSLSTQLQINATQHTYTLLGGLGDSRFLVSATQKEGQGFTTLANGHTFHQAWKEDSSLSSSRIAYRDEGGFILYKSAGTEQMEETYDERALLISRKTPSYLTEYRYNEERMLIEEQTLRSDGNQTLTTYEGGRRSMVEERKSGQTVKISRFLADGRSIVTLFSEGKPYSDVTYAIDGKRVLSISYR